jgi:hypothetical protein
MPGKRRTCDVIQNSILYEDTGTFKLLNNLPEVASGSPKYERQIVFTEK